MKTLLVLLITLFPFGVFSQELSVGIPLVVGGVGGESGIQIIEKNERFFILSVSFCNPLTLDFCQELMEIDHLGNVVWKTILDSSPHKSMSPNSHNMAIIGDSIFTAGMIWKDTSVEIRLMCYSTQGQLLFSRDVYIPHKNSRFLIFGGGIINNEYLVYGFLTNETGDKVYISRFDLNFDDIDLHYFGNSKVKNAMCVVPSKNEGYLMAYSERLESGGYSNFVLNHLDQSFNVTFTENVIPGRDQFATVKIAETEDNGYLLTWQKDLSYALIDTYPFPPAIYKLNEFTEIEWEYIFVSHHIKEVINTKQLEDGSILGMGVSDYWYFFDLIPGSKLNGWCFLMDKDGNLIWEREIKDNRNAWGGRLWDGIPTEDGYIFVGDIDTKTPPGAPLLDDPDVWFMTLDKNGCWNGLCTPKILISDSTSHSIPTERQVQQPLQIYPNPTSDQITIVRPEAANYLTVRRVVLLNMNGQTIFEQDLLAPKSIIGLSHLSAGTYFLQHWVDEVIYESHKIIVQH